MAFFLESTFLGIWIFGWNRLSKKAHLGIIWLVAAGTVLSAMFIMAANSWMQHPVGYKMNSSHQPQLTNFFALFTNPVFLWGYPHVVLASLVTGGLLMLGVSAWHLHRKTEVDAFRRAAVISLAVLLLSTPIAMFVGSELGVVEGKYQPMKIAAAEALWNTCPSPLLVLRCSRSAEGTTTRPRPRSFNIPDLLSIFATNHVDGEVQGLNQLNARVPEGVRPGELRARTSSSSTGRCG